MADITAALVKELRERTGAGMMDCKKALTEANGDIELAIENMRKSGAIKAAKKAGNVAADGVIKTKIVGDYGVILEVNCQTDFVAKDGGFQAFADKVLDVAAADRVTDVEVLKAQFEEERVALVAKIGENINIRRVAILEGAELGSYLHGARIGVLVSTKGANEDSINRLRCTLRQASLNSLSQKTFLLTWLIKSTRFSWTSRCSLASQKRSQRRWLKAV